MFPKALLNGGCSPLEAGKSPFCSHGGVFNSGILQALGRPQNLLVSEQV